LAEIPSYLIERYRLRVFYLPSTAIQTESVMKKHLNKSLAVMMVVGVILLNVPRALPRAASAGDPSLPTPPFPGELPAEVQEARVRQEAQAVLDKYARHYGSRYEMAVTEVKMEGEWAYAVAEAGATDEESLTLLAHRGTDGAWQVLMPSSDGLYSQWIDVMPESLVSVSEKDQLHMQAAESDSIQGTHLVSEDTAARVYTDPLYNYQIAIPTDWRVSPTPADALYGAAIFYNYDPDYADDVGHLPPDALKIQIGVAPLLARESFQDWVAKWAYFEIDNDASAGLKLAIHDDPAPVAVGPFEGFAYTINSPYRPSVLEINLQLSSQQVMVIGLSPADSPAIPVAMEALSSIRVNASPSFPGEVLQIAERWAQKRAPALPQSRVDII
jgi:hypothetical protein